MNELYCTAKHGPLTKGQNLGPLLKNKLQSKITQQNGIFLLGRVNFQNSIAKKIYSENESKIKII
jgi:hypothetical protein